MKNVNEIVEMNEAVRGFQIPEEPMFISFDQQKFDTEMHRQNRIASIMQSVVLMFNGLGLPALTAEEFPSLFEDAECLVYDKMTNGQQVSIAGLTVHKHKAMELLIKPEGYERLIEFINSIKKDGFEAIAHTGDKPAPIGAYRSFELVNGVVTLKESELERWRNQFSIYAVSERAKRMLILMTSIVEKSIELGLADYFKSLPEGFKVAAANCLNGGYSNQFRVFGNAIANYNEPGYRD